MTKNQNYVQFNMLEGSRNLLIITRTLIKIEVPTLAQNLTKLMLYLAPQ